MIETAPNVLLVGPAGSGKTTSVASLGREYLDLSTGEVRKGAGLEVFVIAHEQNTLLALAMAGASCERGFHFMHIPPQPDSLEAIAKRARKYRQTSWEALKEDTFDPDHGKYRAYSATVGALHHFTCMNCGREEEDVGKWSTDKVLVQDSLTAFNDVCMQGTIGRPTAKSQPQWGGAMDQQLNLIKTMTEGSRCWYVLIAHLKDTAKEGGYLKRLRPHMLGQANDPELPKLFSDIILTIRTEDGFSWRTVSRSVDLKSMHIEMAEKLEPSFVPLVTRWREVQKSLASIPQTS